MTPPRVAHFEGGGRTALAGTASVSAFHIARGRFESIADRKGAWFGKPRGQQCSETGPPRSTLQEVAL